MLRCIPPVSQCTKIIILLFFTGPANFNLMDAIIDGFHPAFSILWKKTFCFWIFYLFYRICDTYALFKWPGHTHGFTRSWRFRDYDIFHYKLFNYLSYKARFTVLLDHDSVYIVHKWELSACVSFYSIPIFPKVWPEPRIRSGWRCQHVTKRCLLTTSGAERRGV